MHELSLVGSLLDQVQAICQERHVQRLNSVKIAVGKLSGVNHRCCSSAFRELLPRYFSNSVQLHIEQVPLIAKCPLCDRIHCTRLPICLPTVWEGSGRIAEGGGVETPQPGW